MTVLKEISFAFVKMEFKNKKIAGIKNFIVDSKIQFLPRLDFKNKKILLCT